jgi:enoyl-CoA hydratase
MSVHVSRHDAVTEIMLDRPPANAFDQAQVQALAEAIARVRSDTTTSCVLLTGTGMFSAGADIAMLADWQGEPDVRERTVAFVESMQAVYSQVENLCVPTVAAIGRAATGGGLELALACDLRVVARDVKLGLPEVRIGLIPGAGGTQRMTAVAGPAVAKRLILTGDLIDGETAVALGIAHIAADPADLGRVAATLARRIAALPRPAVAAAKRCIAAAGTPEGFRAELDAVRDLITDPQTATLLAAFAARSATTPAARVAAPRSRPHYEVNR